MNKYLLYFGYIGTQFRGLQRQFCKGVQIFQNETVEGALELGLRRLRVRPINEDFKIHASSRTDAGVHALLTTVDVGLEFPPFLNEAACITNIVASLNKFFASSCFDIRIYKARIVPENFSARTHAIRRTYTYRFGIVKPDVDLNCPAYKNVIPYPILEKDRCYFVLVPDFDAELVREATKLFIGAKDFRAFMGKVPAERLPEISTVRSLENLELTKGNSLFPTPESDLYDFWNITCSSKSFLYRQVRRMVGVLLAVGQHKMTLADVQNLFNNPQKESWDPRANVVPAQGLYLTNIEYNESDLIVNKVETEQEVSSQPS